MAKTEQWDVIVVGAGPAGLSAALILGRCLRRVLVIDTDRPRNAASRALHGFLTRDGIPPRELRRIGREQLARYDTVQIDHAEAKRARRVGRVFEVALDDGRRFRCRKLLLATGVVDEVPALEGIDALYGHSVFHCPYCDGWEFRHQPMAAHARGGHGLGLALELRAWSDDLVLCTMEAAQRAGVKAIAFRCGGWDDDALRGAIAIYDGPWDLLARLNESPLAADH